MFFFDAFSWQHVLTWFLVLGLLIGLNEIIRMLKPANFFIFMILPFGLTFYWISRGDNEITSWFTWVKVYSALTGSLLYMVVRFTDYPKKHPKYLLLIPGILALNILEACIREFQVGFQGFNGIVDGMNYISGGWNYANAIAGIINILLICGWYGIYASRGKKIDMVWPDLTRFYVIAYGIWNISYVYSCAPGNAFYSGFALNIAATIPALFWAKGTWMQTRAHTLSFWMMWVMTFPYFFATGSALNVPLSYNPAANWTLALLSLGLNVVLGVLQVRRIIKYKKNPLKDEIWTPVK